MSVFFNIHLNSTPLHNLLKGFINRYGNLFPDFSQTTIILPNKYSTSEASDILIELYENKNFILPNFTTIFDIFSNNDPTNIESDKNNKLQILNFLLKRQETKDLFSFNDYFSNLELKQLIQLSSELYHLKTNNNNFEQNSGYQNLLLSLAEEYKSFHKTTYKKNLGILNASKIIIFLDIEDNPQSFSTKLFLLNDKSSKTINILTPEKQEHPLPNWNYQDSKENFDLTRQNISYHIAENENEEILAIEKILRNNLKTKIKTHIIYLEQDFGSSLKESVRKNFLSPHKNKISKLIISLLCGNITHLKFKQEIGIFLNREIEINEEKINEISLSLLKQNTNSFANVINAARNLLSLLQKEFFLLEIAEISKDLSNIKQYDFMLKKRDLKTILLFIFGNNDSSIYQSEFAILGLSQGFLLETDQVIIANFNHDIQTRELKLLEFLIRKKNIHFSWNKNNNSQPSNIFYYKYAKKITHLGQEFRFSKKVSEKQKQDFFTPQQTARIHDFSVTEIEKLLRNPYEIYVKRILNLRPKRSETINEVEYGNAVHFSLAEFCKLFHNLKEKEYENILLSKFNQYLLKNNLKHLSMLFSEKFRPLIPQIIKFEQESQTQFSFNLVETKLENKFYDRKNIKIYGRIDRINYNQDKLEVIDFKTGSIATKKEVYLGLKGQILISTFLAKQIFRKSENTCFYLKFTSGKSEIKKVEYPDDIESKLSLLIKKYQQADTALYIKPDPNLEYPDEYKHICRK